MTTRKINLALIGLGYWGRNFYRLINSNKDLFDLKGVVDENINTLSSNIDNKILPFKSVKKMLDSNLEIDAAIVTTPTSTHFDIAKQLLENNINCLVEKPLTTDSSQAIQLYQIAEKNNLVLMVDHTFLYEKSILALRSLIKEGVLGKILHVSFERSNLGPIRTDTNAAWDLSTHDLSILFSFLDENVKKINVSGKAFLNNGIQDIVNISLEFNDIFVTLFSSWLHPEKSRIIKVVGDKKMAVWNGLKPDQELSILDKGIEGRTPSSDYSVNIYKIKSGDITIPNIEKSEPLKDVLIDYYNLINNEPGNEFNSKKLALKVVKTMEEIDSNLNN